MNEYKHGGEIYDKEVALDYSINVNPFGMPKSVKEALVENMEAYVKYPDDSCGKLREAIATAHGITPEMVFCGNGAADVIYRICLAIQPKKAMVLAPTFSEYEQALRMVGSQVTYYELERELGFAVDETILQRIREESSSSFVVFLCNPNNPVGNVIAPSIMEQILALCKELGVYLVVDECFMEFTQFASTHSVVPKLSAHPGVIVLKAFTKTYAMAGLRLGYALCGDATLLAGLKASGPPWTVSTPAQVAGIAALGESEYVAAAREYIAGERAYLAKGLTALGCKVYESHTNYLLFEEPDRSKRMGHSSSLYERMLERKILLRQCGNYHGLDTSFYRITVGLHEDNVKLLQAMEEVWN